MPHRRRFVRVLASLPALALALAAALPGPADARQPRDERKRKMAAPSAATVYDFEMDAIDGSFGATPGGAQDITFFRSRVSAGEIPHANVFTPEGLFSEHDLPLRAGARCAQLLCTSGEAMPAALMVQPEVRVLAQLGFTSGLDPKTWRRDPIHVVAVIDKSGSMSGQPLDLVKESLTEALDHLGPDDQLSIVLYGDRAHVFMAPTRIRDRKAVAREIARIESAGSTAMEEGLKVGFDLARRSQRTFQGTTRVMLFTDERPNVGATDAASFMGMARAASQQGIGMTTVGVGVQFGAELATAVSSVRGGNLFFFSDVAKMKQTFEDDFDTMVTELAYDLKLELRAAKGLKIAGVYGIPGKALEWTEDGAIKLAIETIFLSRKKGAIYVALASDTAPGLPETRLPLGSSALAVTLAYVERGGAARRGTVQLTTVDAKAASVGLQRGRILVDQATTLAKAATLHHEKNDQEGAYQLVHALASALRQTTDSDLAAERTMVQELERTLARLSGHAGEAPPIATTALPEHSQIDRISGLPLRRR